MLFRNPRYRHVANLAVKAKGTGAEPTKRFVAREIDSSDPYSLLTEVFGFPDFRPGQKETIDRVLAGEDTFAVFPTGDGKSLCYQIPALAKGSDLTVVISPLKALMDDQRDKMRKLGIAADAYHSDMTDEERAAVIGRIKSGETRIVLVSPERLSSREMFNVVSSRHVGLFTVDEAHCMSIWGHDFRISYLNVENVVENIERTQKDRPTLLFLSATAPPHIRKDIRDLMGLDELTEVVLPPLRGNLELVFEHSWDLKESILRELRDCKGRKLVYCQTVKDVGDLCTYLNSRGIRAVPYHGQMDKGMKKAFLKDFLDGTVDTVCATSAFGMGIDIPDIRLVIHNDLPYTVEDYYQQVGRAGRDGNPARCVLLYESAWPRRESIRSPTMRSLHTMYELLWGWQERAKELQLTRPDIGVADLTFASALNRIRKLCAGEQPAGKPEKSERKAEAASSSKYRETSMYAALGLLIDNGYVSIDADNKLVLYVPPEKLELNESHILERDKSARARADAITTMVFLDPMQRSSFLASYMTESIEKVMSTYPSTLERIEKGILNIVSAHPGLTARTYAMALNGASTPGIDRARFGDFYGFFPHINYSIVEYLMDELVDKGMLKQQEIKADKKGVKIGYFINPREIAAE